MKQLITFIVTGFLLVGAFGCEEAAKNASETPKTTDGTVQTTDKTIKSTAKPTTIPAASTDTKAKTQDQKTSLGKAELDLKNTVTNKLKTGLPGTKLEVENKDGEIIIKGTATSKEELKKAEKLVKEVKGVKSVTIEAQMKATNKF
ncbi:BON domain-containing protein [Anabaena sp. UHCC 0399]|uniref:BON domain-containing protein n=1 Tax=Anabaena sp. UHCC 0399 TaxID=3110238 RepID=UPI002B206813|nr:BON domain-containing protein [Anabaena sp. UHCC 0399]MEA5564072.1 BON domain-containing protein [Anabaena sp. UHCC 0399]